MAKLGTDIPLWGDCCWVLGHDVLRELDGQEPVGASTRTWKWLPSLKMERPKTVEARVYLWVVEFEDVTDADGAKCADGPYAMTVEVGDFGGSKVVWVGEPEPCEGRFSCYDGDCGVVPGQLEPG
ncbi:hypothetical protein [Arabiibacter massiliensis]|uniref:hypothetical protein n=1 Tax=Arabiibacter massiliensis TaxID=1870985 RepID=UPI0009BA36CE|nr:hypothetical protein [Arabiibacter massiliensis]